MTRKWVGWIVCLVLVAASFGAGSASAEYRERFMDSESTDWIEVSGDATVTQTHGSQGRLLTYLELIGDGTGDADFARAHVDPGLVDTTLTGYELTGILERDPSYDEVGDGPGWFGFTFAETEDGYYIAGFESDRFFVADATDSGMTTVYEQSITAEDWDRIPNIADHRKDDGVDQRLRYNLQLQGTTLQVNINGAELLTTELPSTASGHFGLAAETGTSVHAQEIIYRTFDVKPPVVDIYRPVNNTFYINDMAMSTLFTGGPAIVLGEITMGADVLDEEAGVDNARLYVDGTYVPGSRTTDTGYETNWTLDTSVLDFGYHEFTVRATDNNGNIGEETVRFLVLSDGLGTGAFDDAEEALAHLLP